MSDDLGESIAFAKRRIKSCRVAITDMEARIRQYDRLISQGGGGYEVDALGESNKHAREQIERFRQEISKSQGIIANSNKMKEFLDTKASIAEGVVLDAGAGIDADTKH